MLFSGHVLEAFATGICVLTVQNTGPELLRIGPILSVSVFVGHTVFSAPFSTRSMDVQLSFLKNITQKRGSCTDFCKYLGDRGFFFR